MSDDEPTAEDRRKLDEFKQALDTTRDTVAGMAIGIIGENALERLGKRAAYSVASRAIVSEGSDEALEKVTANMLRKLKAKISSKVYPYFSTKAGTRLFQSAIAKTVAKKATNFFTKNALGMALKYATKGFISLLDNLTLGTSGCAAGPITCAVTVFIGLVMTAMDVFFIISDFSDKKGLSVILSKDFIEDNYRDSYKLIMNSTYDEAYPGNNILAYLLEIDEDTGVPVYADNEFAKKFTEYEDEYMKSQGYSSNWRQDALEASGILGVQEEVDRDLEIFKQNLGIDTESKKNNNKTLIIVLFIFAIITLLIISYVLLT